jgi:hypothetical protein
MPRGAANALPALSPSKGIPTLPLQPCCGISGLADAWHDADPDFPDHARREACEQPELPWDA